MFLIFNYNPQNYQGHSDNLMELTLKKATKDMKSFWVDRSFNDEISKNRILLTCLIAKIQCPKQYL